MTFTQGHWQKRALRMSERWSRAGMLYECYFCSLYTSEMFTSVFLLFTFFICLSHEGAFFSEMADQIFTKIWDNTKQTFVYIITERIFEILEIGRCRRNLVPPYPKNTIFLWLFYFYIKTRPVIKNPLCNYVGDSFLNMRAKNPICRLIQFLKKLSLNRPVFPPTYSVSMETGRYINKCLEIFNLVSWQYSITT